MSQCDVEYGRGAITVKDTSNSFYYFYAYCNFLLPARRKRGFQQGFNVGSFERKERRIWTDNIVCAPHARRGSITQYIGRVTDLIETDFY